jgi:hypothetical protein
MTFSGTISFLQLSVPDQVHASNQTVPLLIGKGQSNAEEEKVRRS